MADQDYVNAVNLVARKMGRAKFTKWWRDNLRSRQQDDRLQQRADLAARFARLAINGRVQLATRGRDCDGVQYCGVYCRDFPASVIAFELEYERENNSADGPFSIWPESPATVIESSRRDLTLEAFEDGHPHILYS